MIFVAVAQLADTLTSLLAPYSSSFDTVSRIAQYSPRYRLSFSLLNEDAAVGDAILRWNIRRGLKSMSFIFLKLRPIKLAFSAHFTDPQISRSFAQLHN